MENVCLLIISFQEFIWRLKYFFIILFHFLFDQLFFLLPLYLYNFFVKGRFYVKNFARLKWTRSESQGEHVLKHLCYTLNFFLIFVY